MLLGTLGACSAVGSAAVSAVEVTADLAYSAGKAVVDGGAWVVGETAEAVADEEGKGPPDESTYADGEGGPDGPKEVEEEDTPSILASVPPRTSGFRAQIGVFTEQSEAEYFTQSVIDTYGWLIDGRDRYVLPQKKGGRMIYRAQVGTFAERTSAWDLCQLLQLDGIVKSCLVVRAAE